MPKWIFWIVQQNSKPAKRRQNVLLLSVSHCRAVTIWGQPFKKLPQIHLCTIDCFEALCKTVVTVFFHYSTAKVAVLVLLKSNVAVDEEEALNCVCELLLCCLLPRDSRGRNRLNSCSFFSTHLEEEVTCLPMRLQKRLLGFSRPWNCSLFSSINPKSIIFTLLSKPL